MSAATIIADIAKRARIAARTLAASSGVERNQLLLNIADELEKNLDLILKANQLDMDAAKSAGISSSLQDRLLLTEKRVKEMAAATRDIAKLTDPLGKILVERNLDNGLNLKQKSVPFGVVGMVYEARPNVTIDIACMALKTGSAIILRGGSAAQNTNAVLVQILKAQHLSYSNKANSVLCESRHRHPKPESLQDLPRGRILIPLFHR